MPGDRVTIATMPDQASAKLIAEMLRDHGVDDVKVRGVPGIAYLPHATALDWTISVSDVDEARARGVLATFEAESAQAAIRQAGDVPDDLDARAESPARRRPWVFWVAMAAVAVFVVPLLLQAALVASHFLRATFF